MRYLLLTAALFLTACGGESEAAVDPDRALCADQAADLKGVRALAADLSEPGSQWGPGGPEKATETAGDAVTALTGYVPQDEQLARVFDRTREAVQALHDDLEDDDVLAGSGQTASTALAALDALDKACG